MYNIGLSVGEIERNKITSKNVSLNKFLCSYNLLTRKTVTLRLYALYKERELIAARIRLFNLYDRPDSYQTTTVRYVHGLYQVYSLRD